MAAKKKEDLGDTSQKQMELLMQKFKGDHLNFQETVRWKASTGSLLFDAELGGGFKAGGIKVCGASFGGKSSCVLTCMANGLKTIENSKGIWFDAEGRHLEIVDRVDAVFVYSAADWVVGTIMVVESNIYELIIDMINNFVKNNPNQYRYLFGIDSADALIRREDDEKTTAEGEKVAAGGLLMSLLFKKAGAVLNKSGHCLFVLSQIRAGVEGKYVAKNQNKSVGGGGSNALTHGVNQVWNFKGRTKDKNIEEGGKVAGHYCEVGLSKGVKERIDIVVKYPVKHGETKGKSVWKEYEISDLLVTWGFVEKRGAWVAFDADFIKELREAGFTVEDEFKVNGLTKLKDWLEENPDITNHLYQKFLKLFLEN